MKNLIIRCPIHFSIFAFTSRARRAPRGGPNAVFAYARRLPPQRHNLYDPWRTLSFKGFWGSPANIGRLVLEFYRSLEEAFARAAKLLPEIGESDLSSAVPACASKRCRPAARWSRLYHAQNQRAIHVLNAPSPGATASVTAHRFPAENIRSLTAILLADRHCCHSAKGHLACRLFALKFYRGHQRITPSTSAIQADVAGHHE